MSPARGLATSIGLTGVALAGMEFFGASPFLFWVLVGAVVADIEYLLIERWRS